MSKGTVGWAERTLNQIADNLDSRRVPITKSDRASGPYPYYGASGIVDYVSDYIFDCEALLISEDGANLLARSTPVAFSVSGKYWVNNHAHVLKFADSTTQRFVEFFFQSIKLDEYITGAAQPKLSQGALSSIPIPIPPLPEQQRIVDILDGAFDGIATAKANDEKNLQNARALFESHLQSVFTPRGEGWIETTLGAEVELLAGFAFKSTGYTEGQDSVKLLRGDNIVQGSLRWDDVKKWPASDTTDYRGYYLCEGDVVLAMDRPWVKAGLKRALISKDDLPCLLVQRTARLRTGKRLESTFLAFLIGCAGFTDHILGAQTGIGVPHISGQQIKDFKFLRPTVREQRIIVGKLDALSAETRRLESIYQEKLGALDALKRSLLHQAFSGAL
jgi:type I restriction enzyme S subunit